MGVGSPLECRSSDRHSSGGHDKPRTKDESILSVEGEDPQRAAERANEEMKDESVGFTINLLLEDQQSKI